MKEYSIENGIMNIEIDSWNEFSDVVESRFAEGPAFIFRGQANYEWSIVSSLDRLEAESPGRKNLSGNNPPVFPNPPLTEQQHLDAFRRAIRGMRGQNPETLKDEELWALGQHHGLATPLLDWTRSPYIALFFAFEEEMRAIERQKPGQEEAPRYRGFYALSFSPDKIIGSQGADKVHLVSPMSDTNKRLLHQAGLFLWMPRHQDLESYVGNIFRNESRQAYFIKIKIRDDDRNGCLIRLNKMNINYLRLFPDLTGAAKHVHSMWQPGHEDSLAYV